MSRSKEALIKSPKEDEKDMEKRYEMIKIAKTVGTSFLIIVGAAFLGVLALLAAFLIPVNEQKVQESYATIQSTDWYPSVQQGNNTYFGSFQPDALDGGTDYLMLQTAAYEGGDESLLDRVMYMSSAPGDTYAYYWHGYVSVLRPLLLLLNYGDIRMLNWIGQTVVILLLAVSLYKEKGRGYVLMLFSSYIMLMPVAVSLSLQFSWVFYIGMLGSLLLVRKHVYFENRYFYFFLITGILTSYFDLLTYPLFTWGVPLLWWLVTEKRDITWKERLRQMVCSAAFWLLGYAGMWIAKWRLANFILKQDVYSLAMDEVNLRSGTEEGAKSFLYERCIAICQNWMHYEYIFYMLILLAWLAWFMYHVIRREYRRSRNNLIYAIIGFSSVVWYYVLSNHTTIHHFFTYRIYSISVLAFMAIALEGVIPQKELAVHKNMIKPGVAVILLLISMGLSLSAREPLYIDNLYTWEPANNIPLRKDEALEFSFVPAFSRVINFSVGTKSSEDRTCEISLVKDGKVLYEETMFHEGDYSDSDIAVNWKLKEGEQYVLRVLLLEGGEDVSMMMSGNEGLTEYDLVQTGDMESSGQPISRITYYARPHSKKTLLFLTLTWLGILCVFVFSFDIRHDDK